MHSCPKDLLAHLTYRSNTRITQRRDGDAAERSKNLSTLDDLSMLTDKLLFDRFTDNNVWPPPCDHIPRDVFDEHGHRKNIHSDRLEK